MPRHVRRLHLRAASDEHARRAATVLSDALHTATLPDADSGRLVVIRRLALGQISPHASSASLALLVERATADLVSSAISYLAASAGTADAVVFPDRGAALVALVHRHSGRVASDEWFWSAVVPGWGGVHDWAQRWRLLLDAAHSGADAAGVAASVAASAVQAGAALDLLQSVRAVHARRWLASAG